MRNVGLILVALLLAATTLPAGAQSELDRVREELAEIRGQIDDAQARADAATERLAQAETDLALTQVAIDELAAEHELSDRQLDELRLELRDFAVERYTGASGEVDVLETDEINAYTVAASLARFTQLDNRDVVDEYRVTAERLEVATEALLEQEQRQEEAAAELAAARGEIDAELANLSSAFADQQAVLDRLEAEERARIEAEIEAERAAAAEEAAREAAQEEQEQETTTTTTGDEGSADEDAPGDDGGASEDTTPEDTTPDAPATPIATGSWICPVQGPVSFVDSWGAPRSGGRSHEGVDMLASTGTPVVAPVSGTVEHRGNSIGGLSFHLNGSDGNYYYGTHLSGYANSGTVEGGTVVGYVGATGNATTPHLHFEIHPGGSGNPVNPYPQVASAC